MAEQLSLTREELLAYNGSDESKPILVGIRGKLYDVSSRKDFYGPGGSYNKFTGHDASVALARTSLADADIAEWDITDLNEDEQQTLNDWEAKFSKYPQVGVISDYPSEFLTSNI